VLLKIEVFWDVMLCGSQHVQGSQCLPLQVADLKAWHRVPPACPYSSPSYNSITPLKTWILLWN